MCTPRSVVTEFAKLKEAITRAGGAEGESAYQEILKRHSVERPSEFKRSQQARFCAKELFQAIERFQEISPAANGAKENAAGAAAAEGLAEVAVSGGQHGD
jgi:hypothetical protein